MKQHLTRSEFVEVQLAPRFKPVMQWIKDTIANEIKEKYVNREFDVDYTYVDFYAWFTVGRMIEYLEEYLINVEKTEDSWCVEIWTPVRIRKDDTQLCTALWETIKELL